MCGLPSSFWSLPRQGPCSDPRLELRFDSLKQKLRTIKASDWHLQATLLLKEILGRCEVAQPTVEFKSGAFEQVCCAFSDHFPASEFSDNRQLSRNLAMAAVFETPLPKA
jgi:hypothetical protein